MVSENIDILTEVAEYYASKLAQYGETPRGVDWNGEESQLLRFTQLCKIIDEPGRFSVNDLGCGYGALFDFLSCRFTDFSYIGIDISADMVTTASRRCQEKTGVKFVQADTPAETADYGIASGIFNVRLNWPDTKWKAYLIRTLDALDRTSRRGFAFNCLTSYSDRGKMQAYLYYADPCELFDLCKRRYARNVVLLHDYELYEFTILVRKKP